MKKENYTWFYYGNGMDDFGKNGKAEMTEMPVPGDDEVLARVDAVAVCASDVKMIHMGNDYPLFKDRDFEKEPVVLGHELSLTVEEVGKNLTSLIKKGMRIGVQPDVYMDHVRYCIGVNVQGGMQKYMLLSRSVFHSDHGVTIFPIEQELSYASVAQLEPNACVEAAYRPFSRTQFSPDKKLFIFIDETICHTFTLDCDLPQYEIYICGISDRIKGIPENVIRISSVKEALHIAQSGFEDLLLIGDFSQEKLAIFIQNLSNDSVFCWMQEHPHPLSVSCDIAKIHYSRISFLGTVSRCLSDAFKKERQRYELKEHGSLLIMGGAGAMGRMHTLRAIMNPNASDCIVVSARSHARLQVLLHDFKQLANKHGKQLLGVATDDDNWKETLQTISPQGYDDIVVSAPGVDPVEKALPFLKEDGMLILFSGTKYGSYAELPIGSVAMHDCQIHASSGSSVEDERAVLDNIYAGKLDPDKNVVGVAGFYAIKEALLAVSRGDFPGKVILYPQIDHLPLHSIQEIKDMNSALGSYVSEHGWNKEAEGLLYQQYQKKGD